MNGVLRAVALAVGGVMVLASHSATSEGLTAAEVLHMARVYASAWQDTLTNLVADEDYTQEVQRYTRGLSRFDQPLKATSRRLHSEVLLVQAPADNYWLSFRDVIMVDGQPVPNRQQRFQDLFASPAAGVIATARLMAQESSRYNLGRVFRTTNTPTAALVFLHQRHAANSQWRLDTGAKLDGRETWVLRFQQRKPPYAIEMSGGRMLPPTGRFWLEPSTARILQWELTVRGSYYISTRVRFGNVRSIDGMVPMHMNEEYRLPGLEGGRGLATYTNHRLFRTQGRIIGP